MGRRSTSPSSRRASRRRRATRPWGRLTIIGGTVAALVLAGFLWAPSLYNSLTVNRIPKATTAKLTPTQPAAALVGDTLPSAPGAAPCTRLNVLASPENAGMVRAVADAYQGAKRNAGGRCVDVKVAARKSGLAADDAARGFAATPADQQPAVWIPDASVWLATARSAKGQGSSIVPESGMSVASTAVTVAMPPEMAAALGWDTKPPTWADVYKVASDPRSWERAGKPEWGYFRIAKANPTMASSGLFALATAYSAAAGHNGMLTTADLASSFVTSQVRLGESATSSYLTTPAHFLNSIRDAADTKAASGTLSAVITDEKSVWEYNRGITSPDGTTLANGAPPKVQLTPYYPSDGVFAADSPAVVLSATWVGDAQRAAGEDFVRFARTTEGQTAVRASGFRDIRGEADLAVADAGHFGTASTILETPSAELVTGLQKGFAAVRKPARVLFAVDVSGSMRDEIQPGVTKIQAAKNAVDGALALFGYDDQVGIEGFSNKDGGALEPGVVQQLASVKAQRESISAKVHGLSPIAYTPLYEAVGLAVDTVGAGYRSDALNSVILLSDGTNDTARPGTLEDTIAKLSAQSATGKKIKVFTLAYGAQADTEALQKIAASSGGQYFDATDPTRIQDVLKDLASSL
ncbi:vWA domain-containing protein [Sinomonas sp. P10A9]|uniref:Substrate-binding domain-containing protein n=1 Tax=Sinomonas puerhi TaxID=3238584 RepID=A0AB39L1K9_9MICC